MQIGLIGGIGPAATDYYYRCLIEAFAQREHPLELTIAHADTSTLLRNLENDDVDNQVGIYNRLTDRLQSAGAQCVVVTSIAGHFCIDRFKQDSPLEVIDMLEAVREAIAARGFRRVGLIGTRTVMETHFYSGIDSAEVVTPLGPELDEVHSAYVSMAASGQATASHSAIFDGACEKLIREAQVDAIVLGGTDLALVYREEDARFPVVDCAAIHVDAIVQHAAPSS